MNNSGKFIIMRTKFWPQGETALSAPNDVSHVPIPCTRYFADCKKFSLIFEFYPLFSRFQKNYSLVLNLTPYFHEQGVNYPFGKTLARTLDGGSKGRDGGREEARI